MLRSISAIAVGFVLIASLALAADAALKTIVPGAFDAAGRLDSTPLLLLTILYVGAFAVAGCYVAALLAPSRPMIHALALGGLGLVVNVAGSIALWHTAPGWYHAVALILVMPWAWLGGRLREREISHVTEYGKSIPQA